MYQEKFNEIFDKREQIKKLEDEMKKIEELYNKRKAVLMETIENDVELTTLKESYEKTRKVFTDSIADFSSLTDSLIDESQNHRG